MSKIIFSGLEGSGKSLKLAMVVSSLVERNSKWAEKSSIVRPIRSNIEFTQEFVDRAESLKVPITYWRNLDELINFKECDVIIDEVGNYFDSRMWADLSLDVRRWLTQGSKSGIEIYGSAQDFAQVDKSFRRLVNELYEIRKLLGSRRPAATKPPVEHIWGVCLMLPLNPQGYDEDKKQFSAGLIPRFFFIRQKFCDIFDTAQKIGRSEYPALRHEERICSRHERAGGDGSCRFCKVVHI